MIIDGDPAIDLQTSELKSTGEAIMRSTIHRYKGIDPTFTNLSARYREQAPLPPWVINCPKCEASLLLHRTLIPPIDSSGFENYSLECGECEIPFAGIVDPYDDVLLLSEPAYEHGPRPERIAG